MSLLKEFKNAGLVSKKIVTERVIVQPPKQGEAPAAVNPNLPQSDINISGHSTDDDAMASSKEGTEPKAAAARSQSQRLVASVSSAATVLEGLLSALCDEDSGFDKSDLAPDRLASLQMMQGSLTHFTQTVGSWDSQPTEAPIAPQHTSDDAAPLEPAAQPAKADDQVPAAAETPAAEKSAAPGEPAAEDPSATEPEAAMAAAAAASAEAPEGEEGELSDEELDALLSDEEKAALDAEIAAEDEQAAKKPSTK